MELERIAAVLRPRTQWEAIDLGFAMVRAWWRTLYRSWLPIVLPIWLAVWLLLGNSPLLAILVLWWLRPLFDRLPLLVLSRALFGSHSGCSEVLRQLPTLLRRHLLGSLTLSRFDPARSFNLPVAQLEGLTGALRRRRAAVLRRGSREVAAALTFACLGLEAALALALAALVSFAAPEGAAMGWGERLHLWITGEAPLGFHLFMGIVHFVAFSVVEPCYVAAGFSLYLNRRTRIEGWDVELALRRLSTRLREHGAQPRSAPPIGGGPKHLPRPPPASSAGALTLLSGALAALTVLTAPEPLPARDWPAGTPAVALTAESRELAHSVDSSALDPDQAIQRILEAPEFDTRRSRSRWQSRFDFEGLESRHPPELAGLGTLLAQGLKLALWISLGLAALLAIRHFRGRGRGARSRALGPRSDHGPLPLQVSGLELSPQSLPADVAGEARALARSGALRQALALLYRGALTALVAQRELPIQPSWTEGDCSRHLAAAAPGRRSAFFSRLTAAWQSAAYAHRPPSAEALEELCVGWRAHFGSTPE